MPAVVPAATAGCPRQCLVIADCLLRCAVLCCAALQGKTAAVFVEPIQGEGGINPGGRAGGWVGGWVGGRVGGWVRQKRNSSIRGERRAGRALTQTTGLLAHWATLRQRGWDQAAARQVLCYLSLHLGRRGTGTD